MRGVKDDGKPLVFIDESGFMLAPSVVATWAPIGLTPIIRVLERHDRLSVIAGVTISPIQRRLGLYFSVHNENITGLHVVDFLRNTKNAVGNDLVVVLDQFSAHKKATRILTQTPFREGSYEFEFLPSYSPELNPVEFILSNVKNNGMANFIPNNIFEVDSRIDETIGTMTVEVVNGALNHTGLEV